MLPRLRFWVALGLALVIVLGGFAAGHISANWANFARAGALLVILGAVMTAWDSLKAGNSPFLLLKHVLSRERMPSETLGLILMVLGTVIWAFGDLVRLIAH